MPRKNPSDFDTFRNINENEQNDFSQTVKPRFQQIKASQQCMLSLSLSVLNLYTSISECRSLLWFPSFSIFCQSHLLFACHYAYVVHPSFFGSSYVSCSIPQSLFYASREQFRRDGISHPLLFMVLWGSFCLVIKLYFYGCIFVYLLYDVRLS